MIQLNWRLSILGMGHKGLAAICYLTPMSGFAQLPKINSWDTRAALARSSFSTQKKLTGATLRFANKVHLTERFNHGSNSRGSGSRLAKSRFEKLLHECIVASRVVNRSRRVLSTVANLI